MRSLVRAPALATFLMLFSPAFAADQADLDRCKFAGELNKADDGISACDRVVSDTKISTQDRANALSSRCGWWWAKKDSDRALTDCNQAIGIDLPLKALVFEDAAGKVWLSYNEPGWLAQRHGLGAAVAQPVAAMEAALKAVAKSATEKS